jgi:hypothetical protein
MNAPASRAAYAGKSASTCQAYMETARRPPQMHKNTIFIDTGNLNVLGLLLKSLSYFSHVQQVRRQIGHAILQGMIASSSCA